MPDCTDVWNPQHAWKPHSRPASSSTRHSITRPDCGTQPARREPAAFPRGCWPEPADTDRPPNTPGPRLTAPSIQAGSPHVVEPRRRPLRLIVISFQAHVSPADEKALRNVCPNCYVY